MKKITVLVMFSLISMFWSCKSDDDSSGGSSGSGIVQVVDGVSLNLKSGTIEDYGEYSTGVYNFDIVLIDKNINNVNGQPVPDGNTFSGVYFELFTDNPNDLAEGVYTINDGFDYEANSIGWAELMTNVDIDNEESGSYRDIISATFTVLDDGNSYEFEFEGVLQTGEVITGNYSGSLLRLDYSDEEGRNIAGSKKRSFFSK
jgi:hypothetical protein